LPPEQQAAADARQQARELALRGQADWSLQGRIAVSSGRNGGSGRIDWRQRGDGYEVELSAPVTRQSWRLSGTPEWARLEGLDGGPRAGADPMALLYEATGWLIPVAALADWVRGLRAPSVGPSQVEYADDGRLSRLQQGGWTIDYRWPDQEGDRVLPERIDARRDGGGDDGRSGEARVKLIVDEWTMEERTMEGQTTEEQAADGAVSGAAMPDSGV
jgi:outer membrane lipoprotein LolB